MEEAAAQHHQVSGEAAFGMSSQAPGSLELPPHGKQQPEGSHSKGER